MRKKFWTSSIIVCAICLSEAKATNITVSDMPGLQTAIAGTSDTIYVTANSYTIATAFTVNRAVAIIGLPAGGNEVVIKITAAARHFIKTSTALMELNSLVLAGPNADYNNNLFVLNGGSTLGGGISSTVTGNTLIINCKVGGCSSSTTGGGISLSNAGSTLEMINSLISSNTTTSHGGGIYVAGALILNNDTILSNKAGYDIAARTYTGNFNGGGVFANSTLTLKGIIVIQGDTASNFGGGVYKGSGAITSNELSLLFIAQNRANVSGGGIYNASASSLNNIDVYNNSARAGGGVYNTQGLTLTNSTINSNIAETTGGGIHNISPLTIAGVIIKNNRAANTGGGIHTTAVLTLDRVRIDSNASIASNGGGIFYGLSAATISIAGSVINNNTAWNCGGGVYTSGPLILTNDTISGNKACYDALADTFRIPGANTSVGSGGGVFANHNLTLGGSILMERDTAVVKGGGIYKGSQGSLTSDPDFPVDPGDLPDTLFVTAMLDTLVMNYCVTTGEAKAKSGDPEGCFGGAIFTAAKARIRRASFFRNSSGDSGAAVWGQGVDIILDNVTAIEGKAGFNPFTKKFYADCSGGVVCTDKNIILTGDIFLQRDTAANTGGALCAFGGASMVTSLPDSLRSLFISGCATVYVTDTFGSFVPLFRGQGGAIVANQDIVLTAIDTIRILDNTSYTYGGGLYSVNKGIIVSRANISGNTARFHGGALYAPNGSVFIDSCRLSRNRAGFDPFLQAFTGPYNGGAIYASKDLSLRGGIILDSNNANNNGGAIAKVVGGKFNISEVTILRLRNNQTIAGPGGKGNGGAIYIEDSLVLNSSINLEISNNRAAANGGAIYSLNKLLSLSEITLGNNHADSSGGAIWSGGPLELIKVSLDSNSAGLNGGAIYSAAGRMDIASSAFLMDSAVNGGAIYSTMSSALDTNKIFNSTFSQNYATRDGGALYMSSANAPSRLTFASFNGNIAGSGSGNAVFFSTNSNKLLRGNIIYGNGIAGTEINQTDFPYSSYNIVRNTILSGGTANLNLAAGNGVNIFETIASGDIAITANNGGLTQTFAIKRNGYAHNYVPMDSSNAWTARMYSFFTDQRDSLRPAGCQADAGSYEIQVADDPASYSIKKDTICGNSFINADTLITSSQFIVDTLYFKNNIYTDTLQMPVQITTATRIYVKFVTTSNCALLDTLTVTPFPIIDSITGGHIVAVNNILPLQSATPGGTWASSDTNIATVSQTGVVTGVNTGEAEISYTLSADTCTSSANKTVTVIAFPLPLTLISFTANRQSGLDNLSWVTAQEIDLSHFEIESSDDDQIFSTIGRVQALGNTSSQQTYSYSNASANALIFYRLKMVDLDGHFRYSPVIRLSGNLSLPGTTCVLLISASPVPFSDKLTLNLSSCKRQQIQFVISDMAGRKLRQQTVSVQRGTGTYLLNNLNNLSAGVYLLKGIGSDGEVFTQKLSKNR